VGNSYNGEGTANTAKTHNTSGKVYKMILSFTKSQLDKIDEALAAGGGGSPLLKSVYTTGEFSTTAGTYVDVTDMSIAVEANKKYAITLQCYCDPQSTSSGMKMALSLPTSYTSFVGKRIVEGGGIGSMNDVTNEPAQIYNSPSTAQYFIFLGFLFNGPNAGNVKLQILSNTAGSSVRLYLSRVLTVEEMA